MIKKSKIQNAASQNATRFIKAYLTEKNAKGNERTWGLRLLPAEAVKIRGKGFYWQCDDPPSDLTYDHPPTLYNRYRLPTEEQAAKWFFNTYKVGNPGSEEGWTTNEVAVMEGLTFESEN